MSKSRRPTREQLEEQIEFFRKLKKNEISTPNTFTVGMGELIREAREQKGLSQSDLAEKLNKRQGTISDIENGKSEIGVLTLAQFSIELNKPISYFFPVSFLLENLHDVKSPFQRQMLELAQNVEMVSGDTVLTQKMVELLLAYFEEQLDRAMHPENYPPDLEDEE
jgi:transcriptional regulator with XRE-family HTH domain